MSKTFVEKKETIERKWFIVDAEDKVLGRMASRIAIILMGKHKPSYTPHLDTGDFVVVLNSGKVKLTGNKMEQKNYYHHSGYPGGIKTRAIKHVMDKDSTFVIQNAVRLMLPKTKLGRQMLKKLKIYDAVEHPHEAQKPEILNVNQFQKLDKI